MRNSGSKLAYFLAGAGAGAAVALLTAPFTGKEARDFIARKVSESSGSMSTRTQDYRRQAGEYVGKARDMASRQKEQLSAALEAGKQAYRDEKTKTTQ